MPEICLKHENIKLKTYVQKYTRNMTLANIFYFINMQVISDKICRKYVKIMICRQYVDNMQICNKTCRVICKKYDKYASKYDTESMCIYYRKYERNLPVKYAAAKYAKFADHAKIMQNHDTHSPSFR
jgi:hypothetical protein